MTGDRDKEINETEMDISRYNSSVKIRYDEE